MTETEKMFAGELYNPFCEGMPEARRRAHELCQRYNALPESDEEGREAILRELMPDHGEGVYLQGPIQFDFGTHISMGDRSYANFNFCVLDENRVVIGEDVFIGPNCTISTAGHPFEARLRGEGLEYAKAVTIGSNVWIGMGVQICPGVTIGDNAVIGAGSVVTKDVPAGWLAYGNPCAPVKAVEEKPVRRIL